MFSSNAKGKRLIHIANSKSKIPSLFYCPSLHCSQEFYCFRNQVHEDCHRQLINTHYLQLNFCVSKDLKRA